MNQKVVIKCKSSRHFAKNTVLIQFRASAHEPGWSGCLSYQGLAPLVISLLKFCRVHPRWASPVTRNRDVGILDNRGENFPI